MDKIYRNQAMTVDEWVEVARERGREEDYDGAIEACKAALTIAPQDVGAIQVMASCYINDGMFDEAEEVLKTFIEVHPDNPKLRLMLALVFASMGENSRALAAADAAMDLGCEEPAIVHFLKLEVFLSQGKLGEAIDSIQAAIEANPDDPQNAALYGTMGFCHLLDGQVQKALEAAENALAIDPDCKQARNVRASVFFGEGDMTEMLTEFSRIPGGAEATATLVNKGNYLLMLGRGQEALDTFTEALEKDKNHEKAIIGVARALNHLNQPTKALETIRTVDPERRPELDGALIEEGNALRELGQFSRALDCFDKAVKLNQIGIAEAHYGRFHVLYQRKEHKNALSPIQDALSIRPDEPLYLTSASTLLVQHLGRPAEGWKKLIRVVYLAERGERYWTRRKAQAELSRVLILLHRFFKAPLLITKIIRSFGMVNTILGASSLVSKAFREARSYDVLRVIAERSGVSEIQGHKLLGLKAYQLGDPFTAERHFDRADDISDFDLQGQFYLIRMYLECQRKLDAECTLDSVRDVAQAVLKSVGRRKKVPIRQLYYAGHLFAMGDQPQPLLALRCFESAAERGMLSAMYMEAQLQHALKGEKSDEFERSVRTILDEERSRMREGSSHRKGFLSGPASYSVPSSWTDGSTGQGAGANGAINSVEAALRAEERALQHWAHVSELSDTFPLIYDWLSKQEKDEGALPEQYRFIDLAARFDHERAIRSWDQEESARERFEEQLANERPKIDVQRLRDTLANRFPVPPGWIGSEEVDAKQLEKWVGQSICEDVKGRNTTMHQLSILYLAICERITPRAAIDLTAYLGCFLSPTIARARQKAIEGGMGGAMVDVSQAAMQLTGAVLGPIVSIASNATVYIVGALIAQQVEATSERSRLSYEEFKADFHDRVDQKGAYVCEQLEELLEEIRAQKA